MKQKSKLIRVHVYMYIYIYLKFCCNGEDHLISSWLQIEAGLQGDEVNGLQTERNQILFQSHKLFRCGGVSQSTSSSP